MNPYLQSCDIIDWQHPAVLAQAKTLGQSANDELTLARNCFEYVRDHIQHAWEYQRTDATTCAASEVLASKTGWCYAKSHLLAALLRANGIPAGLCYQRLTVEGDHAPYCLHGLNAVYLETYGWYRIDPRGNNANVQAAFCPPVEKLAYPIQYPGEADITGIWPQPLPIVTQVLRSYSDLNDVKTHLPDIELW